MCCSSSLQRLTLAQCAAPDSERATLQRLQRLTLSPEVGGTRVESLETCLPGQPHLDSRPEESPIYTAMKMRFCSTKWTANL